MWTWDTGIEGTGYGCFIPSHVLDNPEAEPKVMQFFNWSARWPNFSPSELRSKGNGDLRVHYETLDALQRLRDSLKRPVIVTSYFRDLKYNREVGGAEDSYHLAGRAVDTTTYAAELGRWTLWHHASKAGFKGLGLYDGFTHLDTGPHRVWDNRK